MTDTPSAEQIAANYSAMLDSVEVINNGENDGVMSNDEWNNYIERNKEHLRTMVAKDYWTDEDMTAVNTAIGS